MRSASKLSAFILFVAATPIQSFQVSAPLAPSRVSTRTPLQLAPRPITLAEKRRSATLWSARDESEVERDSDLNKLPLNEPVPINNFLRQLSKLRPLLLSLTIFLLPLFLSLPSWAVQSGGRIGGSVGGSNRSSGGYSRSYGGGGGGSYSSGFSRGYSSGYYSRPSVVVSPGITPYYSPFYSPFSWGYSRPGVIVSTGPSFGGIFFFAGFFLLAALALSSISDNIGSSMSNLGTSSSVLGPGVSVAEISVALEVPDRDRPDAIMNVLERLASTARTDSRVGLQNLTSQVALELLRRKQSIVAASTKAKHFRDESKAQREFNNMSIQERGKFQRETVSRYGGVDYSMKKAGADASPYSAKATVAVVTIVLQIDGDSTSNQLSSRVNSIRDVEEALSRIAADSRVDDCLRGVEILWTPEEREETLTMRDVLADYSDLRSI
ncbi:hypothetical protein ACHAXN_010123 [Cyclotella atomus]